MALAKSVLVLAALVAASGVAVHAALAPAQLQAMRDLYDTIVWANPASPPANWNSTTDPCTWDGVLCRTVQGVQAVLVLQLTPLVAVSMRLPVSFGALTSLNNVKLNSCGLRGPIPASIGNLQALRFLDLSQGTVGQSGGGLSGPIPPELGNLKDLAGMSLSGNRLSGAIPDAFRNLESLSYLALNDNQLSGAVPSLDRLADSLQQLWLHNNAGLYGDLTWLAGCQRLQSVRLAHNAFTGPLSFFGVVRGLQNLDVRGNRFDHVDDAFDRHPNLLTLDLSNNNFAQPLPDLPLPNLLELYLSGNAFTGPVPFSYFANLTSLVHMDLSSNHLTAVPDLEPWMLPNLQCLSLSNNPMGQAPGGTTLPVALVNLTNLESLAWSNAGLIGPVPDLPLSLRSLDLSLNQLSGPFPWSIQNMTNLGLAGAACSSSLDAQAGVAAQLFQLHDNLFSGHLPSAFDSRDAVRAQWPFVDVANVDVSQNQWANAPAWCSAANGLCGRRADASTPPGDGAFFNYSKWPILFQGLFLGGGAVFVIGLIAVCVCLRRRHQQRKNNAHSMGYVSAPGGAHDDDEDPNAVHPDIASLAGDVSPGDPLASPVMHDPVRRGSRASRAGGAAAAVQPSLTPAGASDAHPASGGSSGMSSPGQADSGHNSPMMGARTLNHDAPLLV